jgi:outer membrane protein assembly factor BamD
MIRVLSAFFMMLAVVHLTGCSGKEVNEEDPQSLLDDAEEDIKVDRYMFALEKLKSVKNKYPYSKQAIAAQLRISDVYFMQESFAEAAASYEAFRDLHPKHERVNYAMFRLGLSYYSDTPSLHARDMTPAVKAQEAFQDYLQKFPQDEFSSEARAKLKEVRSALADKELYIANFYFVRDFFDSAKTRYKKVVDQYGDTPQVEVAKKRLQDIEKIENQELKKQIDQVGS